MKKPGTRDQGNKGAGIPDPGSERLIQLLRCALPPVQADSGALNDLWPEMEQRRHAESASELARMRVSWFDWALGLGLAGLLAMFPAWIPVLLYYL